VKGVTDVKKRIAHIKKPIDGIQIMGLSVNAIGEAKHADVAIAFGKGMDW